MALVQLASEGDVKAALGRDLTTEESARVGAILDKTSELFRLRSGQQFTFGTSAVRLRVVADKVTLTQRPVVSVESVTVDEAGGAAVAHGLYQSTLTVSGVQAGSFVRVEYTHGGEAPALVRLTVAEIAKKILSISAKAAAGLTSSTEVTGPYTEQEAYATWAVGGQTMLAPDDAAIAESFRVRSYGAIVQTP